MQQYEDVSGRSGVAAFLSGDDFIKVRFKHSDRVYVYTYRSAGVTPVEEMKLLAEEGEGLATYITRHVRHAYERIEK